MTSGLEGLEEQGPFGRHEPLQLSAPSKKCANVPKAQVLRARQAAKTYRGDKKANLERCVEKPRRKSLLALKVSQIAVESAVS